MSECLGEAVGSVVADAEVEPGSCQVRLQAHSCFQRGDGRIEVSLQVASQPEPAMSFGASGLQFGEIGVNRPQAILVLVLARLPERRVQPRQILLLLGVRRIGADQGRYRAENREDARRAPEGCRGHEVRAGCGARRA